MSQALLLAVRFHEGRYHGVGDWPPAPARVFQALAAGAARGAAIPSRARAALEWLERLPPPVIAAPRGVPGQDRTAFVPNNDLDAELAKGQDPELTAAVAAIRVGKRIRPFLFDVETPFLYCWRAAEAGEDARALCELATGLYRLGRGVDVAWAEAVALDADEAEKRMSAHPGILYTPSAGTGAETNLLCPRDGSMDSLAVRFDGTRNRFRRGGSNRKPVCVFVQPPKPVLANIAYNAPPRRLLFDRRTGGGRAEFAVCRLSGAGAFVEYVRDRAAEQLSRAAPELRETVERYLIGRGATGKDKADRAHIVPIPSVGHEHADMSIRRVAVYAPRSGSLNPEDLAWAFAQVSWYDEDGVIKSELQTTDDETMAKRFERAGRRWQSVTPLALPRARRRRIDPARRIGEAKDGAERAAEEARAAAAVHQALRHAGVRAVVEHVHVQREPFGRRGARAEDFAAGARFPKTSLWHASIVFAEPVDPGGRPLVLGDGRYLGLGLMLADDPPCDTAVFAVTGGLAGGARPAEVARAARRAMIARAQLAAGAGKPLPIYITGHDEDGSPDGGGAHRHIAVVADLPRRRILFVPPGLLRRGGPPRRETAEDCRLLAEALKGMDVLRAGAAGKLALAPTTPDPENDPLFAPACIWKSVTDYDVARHLRRASPEDALKADVAAELLRCGWPRADTIEVLAARRGPRGGLSGRLRLTFRAAQPGPLIIGRTAHKGGGLFAAA